MLAWSFFIITNVLKQIQKYAFQHFVFSTYFQLSFISRTYVWLQYVSKIIFSVFNDSYKQHTNAYVGFV